MAEIIGSAILVLLCLAGLTALLETFCGWLLSPGKEKTMLVLVPLCGHCEDAELLLRSAVQRVHRMGGKDQKTLLCVNCGMDDETLGICTRFCAAVPAVNLVLPEEIPQYFRCNADEKDV